LRGFKFVNERCQTILQLLILRKGRKFAKSQNLISRKLIRLKYYIIEKMSEKSNYNGKKRALKRKEESSESEMSVSEQEDYNEEMEVIDHVKVSIINYITWIT